ncbi:MAG: DUF177 domain-containing protein [Acutalibacteraceae bacterium]|nr:DUF177 domain-containing protein [Acutalibacteraceae bacterium]
MNIDLRGVFSGRIKELPINEKLDFSDLELNGTTPIASLVSVDCNIAKKADIVKIEGKVDFLYKAPCDRCAAVTEREFEIPIEHIIVNSVENEDEEDFIVSENMELDLNELIRTDIALSVPYLFLCKEDCKGICPQCGKNLNKEECTCEKQVDERLAKLSEFFND